MVRSFKKAVLRIFLPLLGPKRLGSESFLPFLSRHFRNLLESCVKSQVSAYFWLYSRQNRAVSWKLFSK